MSSLGVQIISCLLHSDQRAMQENRDNSICVESYNRLWDACGNDKSMRTKIHKAQYMAEDLFKQLAVVKKYCDDNGINSEDIFNISRPKENEHYVLHKTKAYISAVEKGWVTPDMLMQKLIVKYVEGRPIRPINSRFKENI